MNQTAAQGQSQTRHLQRQVGVWGLVLAGHALVLWAGSALLHRPVSRPQVVWLQATPLPSGPQTRPPQLPRQGLPPAPPVPPVPPAGLPVRPLASMPVPTASALESFTPAPAPAVATAAAAAAAAAPGPGQADSATTAASTAATTAATTAGGQPVEAWNWPSQSAAYLNNPPPAYPPISKRLGEQGRVVVRVLIDEQGLPQQAQLHSTSGYSRLDRAAIEAVLSWRFVPGQRGGRPEAMWFQVPITFDLKPSRE